MSRASKKNNPIIKIILPLILLLLAGFFILQSANRIQQDRDVYFEYSAKCNLWEVRDMETGTLKSRVTEGLKQLYELSGTRYAPLIKIDDQIVGHHMDEVFDWSKPFLYNFIDGKEAVKIYGSDAKYGLAEFEYSDRVESEFKSCTSTHDDEDISGLPLILYEGTFSKKTSKHCRRKRI